MNHYAMVANSGKWILALKISYFNYLDIGVLMTLKHKGFFCKFLLFFQIITWSV